MVKKLATKYAESQQAILHIQIQTYIEAVVRRCSATKVFLENS